MSEPGLCASAPHDVEDLIDGLLDPAAETALLAHLATCPACRAARAEEERLRDLLAAPAGLADEIMDRVHRERRRARPGALLRLSPPRLAAAAAVLMAVTIAVLLSGSRDEDTPFPPRPRDETPMTHASARARDLARRARIFLATAEQAPPETLGAELEMSGLAVALHDVDLGGLEPSDRAAVRRVALLGEAWRNDAPIARAEIALLTEGL